MDARRIDGHKLALHPHRVAAWRDAAGDWEKAKGVYPIYVEVSPMGACNHRCTFCAVDYIGYKTVALEEGRLSDILREMGALGVRSVMFAGEGEPLLHKQINKIVLSAPMDVAFTTNGVLLHKLEVLPVCKWVKVSMNAGTRDTYASVHRTREEDFDRVWENIAEAVKRKGGCEIGVQMVLLPENEGEVEEFRSRCEHAGVDYAVVKPYSQHRFSRTRKYEGYKPVAMPENGKRLVVREESFGTQEIGYDVCHATPWFWAYIMASGDVYSCSAYLLDERFRLGNVNEASFKEIWEGERRRKNWELMRSGFDIHECRLNCRMDKANKYLAEFDTVKNASFI